ncbi:MAG TPA: ChbG/HpnK family deacetylase [Armatimonadota bacterium]|jgi:predicted glycoside hydrolase/deacetylase ChbG (UPF0249 family)
MRPLPLTLVVNADDLGLSASVNRGIEHAFRAGLVRSASLMPNGAAWEDALAVAARCPGLGVGVHLSLVGESALTAPAEIPGLASPDGLLPASYGDFMKRLLTGRFGAAQVEIEIRAQVGKCLAAGLHPTHLDSHQHLHAWPALLAIVQRVAAEYEIPVIRMPAERGGPGGHAGPARRGQVRLLSLLASRGARRVRGAGLRCADHFWGTGVSGALDETALRGILERLRPGVNELMCHPGYRDEWTGARYQWGYEWETELAALTSPRARELVASRGIRLANFAEAWEESGARG